MMREHWLAPEHLVYPMFVQAAGARQEIASMPGQYRWPVAELVEEARRLHERGLASLMLFGLPETKDDEGGGAWAENGVVQTATRALKRALPALQVITDVCLCEYTRHGHCGVLHATASGVEVLNDPTLELLARTAVSHARAGADMVAPSDMMDGRVGAIRRALDSAGFAQTPILAYAAKFATAFYGPFREAADSAPQQGDRSGYQMDMANGREALHEMQLDFEEGADMLMVKPALPCLDILAAARARFPVPLAAYQVSGEYAMIKAAARAGWLEEARVVRETLLAIRRAGADMILSYFTPDLLPNGR